jgi:group I intron endonuclease
MIGIYQIKNKFNNKRYIGKSKNIFKRLDSHIEYLLSNKHHNYYLQKDFIKNGYNGFTYEILDICDFEDLNKLESEYINQLDINDYNINGINNKHRKPNKVIEKIKTDEMNIDGQDKTNNSAIQFVEECCEINDNSMISSRGLYNYYSDWSFGGSKMPENKFISTLKKSYNLKSLRKRIDNKRLMYILGLKYKIQ